MFSISESCQSISVDEVHVSIIGFSLPAVISHDIDKQHASVFRSLRKRYRQRENEREKRRKTT